MIDPLSSEEFTRLLTERFAEILREQGDVAVGLSGGPDSMALAKLLSDWAAENDGPRIHALIVDHGLRANSAQEASLTASRVANWPKISSSVLTCQGLNTQSCIMEDARRGRYEAMNQYCVKASIQSLFLAHHQDDQAETVLFRLAKGSGLDGLGGMKDVQEMNGVKLLRPLLDIPKARLVATCEANGVEYVRDPSNESENFARVRLRKSMDVLEGEGLSAKRLSTTARRLARARAALEELTEKAAKDITLTKEPKRIVLNFKLLSGQPEEITLRLILQCFGRMGGETAYAPRMEKVEALCCDLLKEKAFRKRTLGGLVFERDDEKNQVIISEEK